MGRETLSRRSWFSGVARQPWRLESQSKTDLRLEAFLSELEGWLPGGIRNGSSEPHIVEALVRDLLAFAMQRGGNLKRAIQPPAVGFVHAQTVKSDKTPCHIISALVGKKIANQVAAAAGNNARPKPP